jgi:hypothetical protein
MKIADDRRRSLASVLRQKTLAEAKLPPDLDLELRRLQTAEIMRRLPVPHRASA